jgi:hypothetical protein
MIQIGQKKSPGIDFEKIHINSSNQFLLSEQVHNIINSTGYNSPAGFQSILYESFIREMAQDPNVPNSFLEKAYTEGDKKIKAIITQYRNSSFIINDATSQIKSSDYYNNDITAYLKDLPLFYSLSSNPNTSPDTLREIYNIQTKSKRPEEGVIAALLINPNLPTSLSENILLKPCNDNYYNKIEYNDILNYYENWSEEANSEYYYSALEVKILMVINNLTLISECLNKTTDYYIKYAIVRNPYITRDMKIQINNSLGNDSMPIPW